MRAESKKFRIGERHHGRDRTYVLVCLCACNGECLEKSSAGRIRASWMIAKRNNDPISKQRSPGDMSCELIEEPDTHWCELLVFWTGWGTGIRERW